MTAKKKKKNKGHTFKYIQGLNFINAYILNSYHTQEVHFSNKSKGVLIVIVSTEANCEVKVDIHHHVLTPNRFFFFFFTRLTILLTRTHTHTHHTLSKIKRQKSRNEVRRISCLKLKIWHASHTKNKKSTMAHYS